MTTRFISKLFLTRIVVAYLVAAGQAKAQTISIYDNGPINGTIGAWLISSNSPVLGLAVSDSFTVSSSATLTSAVAGLWVANGVTLESLQWMIGTTPFSCNISSGTASLDNTYFGPASLSGTSVYASDFAINGSVTPGIYYLTLTNAVASVPGEIGWDQNNGPSSFYDSVGGNLESIYGSESFQVFGVEAAPEPTTASLLSVAAVLGAMSFQLRKKA